MSTLLYDGDCRLCALSVNALHRLAPSLARVGSWQSERLPEIGLAPVQPRRSLHWIGDGEHVRGVAAVAGYLRSSTSKPWRRAGVLLGRPSVVSALEVVPDKVARLRKPGRPLPVRPPLRRPPPSTPTPESGNQSPPAAPKVRRRSRGDLQSAVRLLYAARDNGDYRGDMPDSPSEWLEAPGIWAAWVIRPGPSVLGHVAVSRMSDDPMDAMRWKEITGLDLASLALVTRLLVHPDAQGKGYDEALLAVADREIRRRGQTPAMELVTVSGEPLPALESAGWTLLGLYPWGEPADALQKHYYIAPHA